MLRVAKHLGLSSQILRVAQDDTDGAQFVSVVAKHAQKSIVILSVAKHPAAKRDRPFAAAQGDTCWTQRLLTLLTCATELPPGSKTKRKGDQVVLVSPVPVAADAPDTFASSLPVDCADFCFGSRGVSAFDTRKPVTAPMAITGNRSVCPPSSPSSRVTVKGMGKPAHATPAIPARTPTPCGINVKTWEIAKPSVPPMKSKGKTGPPSKPVANDVLVSRALTNTISNSNPTL